LGLGRGDAGAAGAQPDEPGLSGGVSVATRRAGRFVAAPTSSEYSQARRRQVRHCVAWRYQDDRGATEVSGRQWTGGPPGR
jgi:hypothetical protein